MLQTVLTNITVTNNQTIELENVTSLQIIQDQTNNQRVFINGIPLIDRVETILPADGTVCKVVSLSIEFNQSLIPTSSPVSIIHLRIRKLKKCASNG